MAFSTVSKLPTPGFSGLKKLAEDIKTSSQEEFSNSRHSNLKQFLKEFHELWGFDETHAATTQYLFKCFVEYEDSKIGLIEMFRQKFNNISADDLNVGEIDETLMPQKIVLFETLLDKTTSTEQHAKLAVEMIEFCENLLKKLESITEPEDSKIKENIEKIYAFILVPDSIYRQAIKKLIELLEFEPALNDLVPEHLVTELNNWSVQGEIPLTGELDTDAMVAIFTPIASRTKGDQRSLAWNKLESA